MRATLTGAWRQAGVIAAAALVALDEGPGRLHEYHENAQRLAEGVAEVVPGALDPELVETNIVFADPSGLGLTVAETADRLRAEGVLVTLVAGKFFFSSRRRHTRFDCDWSSDVCSSD